MSSSGSLTESEPGRVCAGAIVALEGVPSLSFSSELLWASRLRILWKSRRRDMEDKKQKLSKLHSTGCQSIPSIDKNNLLYLFARNCT